MENIYDNVKHSVISTVLTIIIIIILKEVEVSKEGVGDWYR